MAKSSEKNADKPYEIGVLLVHGIGKQKRGDTLLAAGESIRQWLELWTEHLESPRCATVSMKDVDIHPDGGDAPASAEIQFDYFGKGKKQPEEQFQSRWLLAESHWADCYRPPESSSVASWLLLVGPWVIASVFQRLLKYNVHVLRAKPTSLECLFVILRLLVMILMGLLAPVLAAGLALFSLATLVLSFIPIAWLQSYLRSVQGLLAEIVGDSFVFTQNPVREAAIVTRVKRDLEQLSGKCDHVFVVAHSQGAGVSFRVLQQKCPDELKGYFTIGSGLNKLLRLLPERKETGMFIQSGVLGFAFTTYCAIAVCLMNLVSFPNPKAYLILSLFIYVLFGVLPQFVALFWNSDESIEKEIDGLGELIELNEGCWHDFYTPQDPVPAGPMLLKDWQNKSSKRKWLHQSEVQNAGSWIHDHTSYWANLEQVTAQIGHVILCEISPPSGFSIKKTTRDHADPVFEAARSSRKKRVMLRRLGELFLVACTVGFLFMTNLSDTSGGWIKRLLASADDYFDSTQDVAADSVLNSQSWHDGELGAIAIVFSLYLILRMNKLFEDFLDRCFAVQRMRGKDDFTLFPVVLWPILPASLFTWLLVMVSVIQGPAAISMTLIGLWSVLLVGVRLAWVDNHFGKDE